MNDEHRSDEPRPYPIDLRRRADVALAFAGLCVACVVGSLEISGRSSPPKATVVSNIFALAALVFAYFTAGAFWPALNRYDENIPGMRQMYASLALAFVALVFGFLAGPGFHETSVRAKISRVHTDMRILADVMESFRYDYGAYPAWTTGRGSENAWRVKYPPLHRLPSYRLAVLKDDPDALTAKSLTTPIAYLGCYLIDPFAPVGFAVYPYCCLKQAGTEGWMLVSAGPDRDYDIDPLKLYDVSAAQPRPALLALTYDPTNGILSSGDLWRSRQNTGDRARDATGGMREGSEPRLSKAPSEWQY